MKVLKIIVVLLSFMLIFNFKVVIAEGSFTETDLFTNEQIEQWMKESEEKANAKTLELDKGVNPYSRSAYGGWTWRDGVICVTDVSAGGVLKTWHAGIIAPAPYYYATLESNPESGVHVSYGSWDKKYASNNSWQYGVSRTTEYQDQKAAEWAAKQIGKPYNWTFTEKTVTHKFYCSQLVWASYYYTTGIDLDTYAWGSAIHPQELRSSSETTLIYHTWQP